LAGLSKPQYAYAQALAAFDAAHKSHLEYGKLMDAECERLGIATPFGVLPEGHPMWAQAQALLDAENALSTLMYEAAHNLFEWATEITLAKMGTEKQKADIRAMVAAVKKKSWVERPFQELVDLSMRLTA
jgi:hypothetical protein